MTWTLADFQAAEGEAFAIAELPSPLMLTAIEVAAREPERRAFSLLFRRTVPEVLPQGTYRLTHARLGEADVFIVPVGREGESVLYEAVFN